MGLTPATFDINSTDFSEGDLWVELGGTPGSVYEWMGPTTAVNLGSPAHPYTDLGWWKPVPVTELIPQGFNFTKSPSVGIGGLVVLNDVRSDVEASIASSAVTAASIAVLARRAGRHPRARRQHGVVVGRQLLERPGQLAGNERRDHDQPDPERRTLVHRRRHDRDDRGGPPRRRENVSQVDATTLAATSSGNQAVGILLAFNTIGWNPTNVLFAAIDALLGDPLISEAFDGENPAETLAYMRTRA